MATKILITITPDDHFLPHGEPADTAMARTIDRLAVLGIVPLRKIALQIECMDGDARAIEDAIDAALSGRPAGIEVTLKTTRERFVGHQTMASVTPMDVQGWQQPAADPPAEETAADDGLGPFRRALGDEEADEGDEETL